MLPGAILRTDADSPGSVRSVVVGGMRKRELELETNFRANVVEGVQRTASSLGWPRIVTL